MLLLGAQTLPCGLGSQKTGFQLGKFELTCRRVTITFTNVTLPEAANREKLK